MNKSELIPSHVAQRLVQQTTGDWLANLIHTGMDGQRKHVKLKSYCNGALMATPPLPELYEHLRGPSKGSKLENSFRLTNVQLLDPIIAEACQNLEQHYGQDFFCNLYFTPREGRDSFVYHADLCEIVVFQLQGQKDWRFFRETNGNLVTHLKPGEFVPTSAAGPCSFRLTTGNEISFPYGVVHAAHLSGDIPSIHLTFSTREVYYQQFLSAMMNAIAAPASGALHRQLIPTEEGLLKDAEEFVGKLKQFDPNQFVKLFLLNDLRRRAEFKQNGKEYFE